MISRCRFAEDSQKMYNVKLLLISWSDRIPITTSNNCVHAAANQPVQKLFQSSTSILAKPYLMILDILVLIDQYTRNAPKFPINSYWRVFTTIRASFTTSITVSFAETKVERTFEPLWYEENKNYSLLVAFSPVTISYKLGLRICKASTKW